METKIPPPIVTLIFGLAIYFSREIFPVVEIQHSSYLGIFLLLIGFFIFLLRFVLFYSGFNTGVYFIYTIGVLIGVGLGSTAIGIPVSVVAKHFPASKRTIATGIVTCAGSFGYFVSPVLVKYSLNESGWENTIFYFSIFFVFCSTASFIFFEKTAS